MGDLRTVEDLRRLVAERGHDPREILTSEEAQTRNSEACHVMSLLPDGRMDVTVRERVLLFHEVYEDEPTAVNEVSKRFKPLTRRPAPSPEQLAWSRAGQEARRQELIRGLEEPRREPPSSPPPPRRVGEIIDRFGPKSGEYAHAEGTPFAHRSLPPSSVEYLYDRYEVLRPLPGDVREGLAAPWFGQPGLGLQYHFPGGLMRYIDEGYLAPVD